MKILDSIFSPEDLEKVDNLDALAQELRAEIISLVSQNGGHLSSNLGTVEATIALLKVFGEKKNAIIWDVGHQCYAYKILTGRKDKIHSIRKKSGLSGFTNYEESDYDKFKSGHSGNSISLALGISEFKLNFKKDGKVIVFIGDGSMTCGLAYEGLNNASSANNLIIILNDNSMSISKNVGAISKYLSKIRTNNIYLNTKYIIKKILSKIPNSGKKIDSFFSNLNIKLRNLLFQTGSLFENLGFKYYGPIDGHDIHAMIKVMQIAKKCNKPVLIHIVTKKGKGYKFAENKPDKFHGISRFDINTGNCLKSKEKTFSDIFGEHLCNLAEKNDKIYAITAAMSDGTGLSEFSKRFPKQFKDVGIAESHAVTFAAGLAAGGYTPIFAVYSSFLQRSFDQLIHDTAMQNLKIILAIDRAGFVGEDGESHQGIFDIPMLNSVPNIVCYSPSFFDELKISLELAIKSEKFTAVRYPKGTEFFKPDWLNKNFNNFDFYGKNKNLLVITYGRIFSFVAKIFQKFSDKISLLKLNKIIPLDNQAIIKSREYKNIIFFEESYINNSISEKFGLELLKNEFKGKFVPIAINNFVKHATMLEQLKEFKLDYDGMLEIIEQISWHC